MILSPKFAKIALLIAIFAQAHKYAQLVKLTIYGMQVYNFLCIICVAMMTCIV